MGHGSANSASTEHLGTHVPTRRIRFYPPESRASRVLPLEFWQKYRASWRYFLNTINNVHFLESGVEKARSLPLFAGTLL
jgi:hypothetical protein